MRDVRRVFVIGAVIAVAAFILLRIWGAIDASGPAARVKQLTAAIDAELIDRPVPPRLMNFPVQGAPMAGMKPGAPGSPKLHLSDYPRNELILLNFWASWCAPCRREMPSMLKLRQKIPDSRFAMLLVSYDDSWNDIAKYFQQMSGGLPGGVQVALDPNKSDQDTMRYGFGTEKLPETYVIRNGRILARIVNSRDWTDPAVVEYFQRLLEMR